MCLFTVHSIRYPFLICLIYVYVSAIVKVMATDKDRGENGAVKYGIVFPTDDTFFIGRDDGIITVGRDIDREKPEKYIQVCFSWFLLGFQCIPFRCVSDIALHFNVT